MAIFDRISSADIEENFSHYGLFCGFVPVYVGDMENDCSVAVRNWWPDWLFNVAVFLLDAYAFTLPHKETVPFPIVITGRIKK